MGSNAHPAVEQARSQEQLQYRFRTHRGAPIKVHRVITRTSILRTFCNIEHR